MRRAKMWRSIHIKTITALIVSMVLILPCYGDEEKNWDRLLYPEFSEIKYFGVIYVIFRGKTEGKLGLNKKELTDFLRLKYKNNFANIPYKSMSSESVNKAMNKKEIGFIYADIWAVGEDYPIAFHIKLVAGCWEKVYRPAFEHEYLGVTSEELITQKLKKGIGILLEDFAITFFKARGEM
jgi:hypothetical protein